VAILHRPHGLAKDHRQGGFIGITGTEPRNPARGSISSEQCLMETERVAGEFRTRYLDKAVFRSKLASRNLSGMAEHSWGCKSWRVSGFWQCRISSQFRAFRRPAQLARPLDFTGGCR
jgi:hypothetical protein